MAFIFLKYQLLPPKQFSRQKEPASFMKHLHPRTSLVFSLVQVKLVSHQNS